MNQRRIRVRTMLISLICLAAIWSCAGRTYMMVDYQIPRASQELDGLSVRLGIDDQRDNPAILSPAAARKFRSFQNRYSLAWITPKKERVLAGEHQLSALFRTTFEKRLQLLGAQLNEIADPQVPVLLITIERFNMDLKDHKWISDIAYSASLTKEGHPLTKENVRGNAERLRVIGRKGADMVVSDIFTDVVNRLDIIKLFQNAELIP